jgi:hypothetical protein
MLASCLAAAMRRLMAEVQESSQHFSEVPLRHEVLVRTFAIKTRQQGPDVTWPGIIFALGNKGVIP